MSRLTSEGLVEIERHRGFRVAPISQKGYRELAQACLTVELPCLRSSIENGDVQWELNLVATYHRAVRTLELVVAGKEDLEAYSTERLAFYEALLGACRSEEQPSELQSLMRISYAVFCLKKQNQTTTLQSRLNIT